MDWGRSRGGGLLWVVGVDVVEDGFDFGEGGDADEAKAEGLEVEEAAEVGAIVLAHFEDSGALALERGGGPQVAAAHLDTLGHRDLAFGEALEKPLALLEYPGVAYGAASYQDAVDTMATVVFHGLGSGDDVAVAKDGDVDAGVVFHLPDGLPIGGAAVHLGFGAAMDGKGGDTGVLQCLGEVGDGHGVGVVGEACLDGDGQMGVTH